MPFVRAVENHVWLKETVSLTEGLRSHLVAEMLESLMEVVRDNARRKPKVLVHSMARLVVNLDVINNVDL